MGARRMVFILARAVGIGAVSAFLLLLVLIPCPPWSLKVVNAQRTQCMANLHALYLTVRERGILLDEEHTGEIEEVIAELALTCPEGSNVRKGSARYHVLVRDGKCIITEEPGNHPARNRFLAGTVPEERFEVDVQGHVY